MKLGLRIFACYIVVFVLCLSWPFNWVLNSLKTRYYESVEEPLVDQANILAAMIGTAMDAGDFPGDQLAAAFDRVYKRQFSAQIYDLEKTGVDIRIYVTDTKGILLFDSKGWSEPGEDYSKWHDVSRTLAGEYGARTSRMPPPATDSSILYVAAPIMTADGIAGVLTVGKPTTNIISFIDTARPRFYRVGALALLAAAGLSLLLSLWITRPIKDLTRYASAIGLGKRAPPPKLNSTEIGELSKAFEGMRQALEGKRYAEQYVQTLTHEIKSPLSAIRGAAELLGEDLEMEKQRRDRFLANIRNESGRIQRIVDRMLELASLENRKVLGKREHVDLSALIDTVVESKEPLIDRQGQRVEKRVTGSPGVTGDAFLLFQAVANLVQNAIDFTSDGGLVRIGVRIEGEEVLVTVEDNGAGIPDYAVGKVFDKFFSLARPENGVKSTGLGLNLVREVVQLHGGDISLVNRPEGGAAAVLRLPLA